METVKFKLSPGAKAPFLGSAGASGWDVFSFLSEPVELAPLERAMIPTGLYVEIPTGFELQVRPRSGLAAKEGITVLNTPGTIDSDYRGKIKVILINLSSDTVMVTSGMRIAQLVLAPVCGIDWEISDCLSSTSRDAGGFGHTGI